MTDHVREVFSTTNFSPEFDILSFKTRIDELVDPATDRSAIVAEIDALEDNLRAVMPADADAEARLLALRRFLYRAGDWNGQRAFEYDTADPYGQQVENKLLSDYLQDRSGNCVTMPILFAVLGQRIGLDLGLALAPRHVVVKYTDAAGDSLNLEATSSGGSLSVADYRQYLPVSDTALEHQVYFQRLDERETAALLASSVIEKLMADGKFAEAVRVADFLIEQHPKFVWAMSVKALAIQKLWTRDFVSVYAGPEDIPEEDLPRFSQLVGEHRKTLAAARALGWQPVDLPEYGEVDQ